MNQPISEPQLNHSSRIGQKEYIFLRVEPAMLCIKQENRFSIATIFPSLFFAWQQQEEQPQAIPNGLM